jgi:hypothetical protein
LDETFQGGRVAFHFGHQAGGGIENVAAELQLPSEIVNEGPKADALHDATQPNSDAPAEDGGREGHLIRF